MRHVKYDPTNIDYPADWLKQAEDALKAVEAASPDERAKTLNKQGKLWSALKPELEKLLNNKCWYTEAPQIGTDTDVDHFRPKNAVQDVVKPGTNEKHPGYWWYAFNPENYRFSCILANRRRKDIRTGRTGGKSDRFPIWDENKRAWNPDDDTSEEQPLLIDPCIASEVALIMFAENGEAQPRYNKGSNPRLFKKADLSIKLYNINHSEFVKARINIRNEINKKILSAKRYFRHLESGDSTNEFAYAEAITFLIEACSEKAPFSSFAIAIIEPHKTDISLAPLLLR